MERYSIRGDVKVNQCGMNKLSYVNFITTSIVCAADILLFTPRIIRTRIVRVFIVCRVEG